MLGLMRLKDGPVRDVLQRLDVNMLSMKTELEMRVREDELNMPINTSELVLN